LLLLLCVFGFLFHELFLVQASILSFACIHLLSQACFFSCMCIHDASCSGVFCAHLQHVMLHCAHLTLNLQDFCTVSLQDSCIALQLVCEVCADVSPRTKAQLAITQTAGGYHPVSWANQQQLPQGNRSSSHACLMALQSNRDLHIATHNTASSLTCGLPVLTISILSTGCNMFPLC
jgi:hypothetical protein